MAFGKSKKAENNDRWRTNYYNRLQLRGLTDHEKMQVQDMLGEVSKMFNVDNVDLMPPLYAPSGEDVSSLTRLWLISRQNWMIIEQLSRLNQNMEKLLELEKSYADQ